jgi:hypothetical protein
MVVRFGGLCGAGMIFNQTLEIETCSYCNRSCPTCIRNSSPYQDTLDSWFTIEFMPTENILEIVKQAYALGFRGWVNLSRFNEPLFDSRLPELGKAIKEIGNFDGLMFHSNGDLLDKTMALKLDGIFDLIVIASYGSKKTLKKRKEFIKDLFTKTQIIFVGDHQVAHYYPIPYLEGLIKKQLDLPCFEPTYRILFNYRGELIFCCEEVTNQFFNFGSFPEKSVEELLSNPELEYTINALQKAGGRRQFPLCSTCPR